MADDKATSILMSLPLEVRHTIFEHAVAHEVKPKKLLRYWFEKKEVKEIIEKNAVDNPDGPTPQVIYNDDDYDEDSEIDEEEAEEQESASEDEDEDQEGEDQEDEENMDEDDAEDDAEVDIHEEEENEEDDMDEAQDEQDMISIQPPASEQVQNLPTAQGEDGYEQAETDMEDDEEAHAGEADETETEATHNNAGDDGDEAMAEESGHGNDTANATQPPRAPRPIVRAHQKWRHIPKFMRLTHCPPPIELLLTSKQLNDEAKNWYYDVAVLRIEATGSFAHTSFYEEAFSQITEAPFSPMENIRKVEVTFVWDTTWIRADETGCVEAIFPALLRQRTNFVYQILRQAPDLREVVIHWHDSAQDSESANLRIDVLDPFDNLPATVEIIEHYIPADSKPNSRSIAGKRRVEFQNILDMGLDRLF
ncbi:Nn.00g024120.m01.CDS01 [Neocucurbitaria sp. VM-36]